MATEYEDPATKCFVKLLDNRITVTLPNDVILEEGETAPPEIVENVEVLTQFEPRPQLECITMSKEGGMGLTDVHNIVRMVDLPSTDPDFIDGQTMYAREFVRREKFQRVIALHVWSKYPEIKNYIVHKIYSFLRMAKSGCYHFCANYDPVTKNCSTTNNQCDAITNQGFRGKEQRCPFPDITDEGHPNYRNPRSLFADALIRTESVEPRGENNVDQPELTPAIYHTAIMFDYEIVEELVKSTEPFIGVIDTMSDGEVVDPNGSFDDVVR